MKNKKATILALFFLLFPVFSSASETEWRINDYYIKMSINKDASVDVSEEIRFDFGNQSGHGIYRVIPYRYQARGGFFSYKYSNFSVTDENGHTYTYTKENNWTNLSIKVGEEDKLISGEHTYIISYKIKRAINYFDNHDELYWNAVGTEWENRILNANAEVFLPEQVSYSQAKSKCYFGIEGSTLSCQQAEFIYKGDMVSGYRFRQEDLSPGQALTIVSSFPKGTVYEPTFWENFLETAKDNWIIIFPFLTFAFMFKIWHKKGKDPKGTGTIIAQYDPPDNLSPAEVGTVIDSHASNKDVSSEIIQLAILGYIKLNKIENKKVFGKKTDYRLDKLKEPDNNLNVFQKKLLMALFTSKRKESFGEAVASFKEMFKKGNIDAIKEKYENKGSISSVMLLDLKDEFYQDLRSIVSEIYKSVVDKEYFPKSPSTVKTAWASLGIGVGFIGFLTGAIGLIWVFSLVISGIIIVLFGLIMPKVTQKGAIAKEHILGLREYLEVAEKERIKFHNAPEKNPQLFEKLLPYAMVLEVEKQWAKQFEGIYGQNPSWYSDSSGASFNAVLFASSLNSFTTTATQTLSSAPGGGSGFGGGAGGGGGGGGGGGW